jgi:hypothetical protein
MMTRGLMALVITCGSACAWAAGPVTEADAGELLARAAMLDLGMRDNANPADYTVAAQAMAIASASRPGDAELARLVGAAAWGAGDQELLMEATRRIIRADPADTVAQLRLISAGVNQRQTVEDRIAAYERFLGPDGKRIDPSVRSRLALDAALLERERGRNEAFERLLRQAVDLDITNKDAVSLAARTFGTEASGANGIVEWQTRLLYADPLDPHVHLTIARLCAGQGALSSAERFLNNGITLFKAATGETPAKLREEQLALQWQQQGPKAVLDVLNPPLYDLRREAGMIIEARKEAGEPYDDIKNPEDIRYDLGVEKIRLLAAHAAGDEEAIANSLADLARTTTDTVRLLSQEFGKVGADQGTLSREMIRVFTDQQVSRGLVGREGELMAAEVTEFRTGVPGGEAIARQIEPWLAYVQGDAARALQLVGTPRADSLDNLIVALASEKTGDLDRAAEIYTFFARTKALEAFGAFSRSRLRAIGREGEAITASGRQMETGLAKVPGWMDRMLLEARSFMTLQTDASATNTGPLDSTSLRVSLRNTAPIPLGLGTARPIGSRFLIAPRPTTIDSLFRGTPTPRVLDLDQRLRLEPLTDLVAVVRADSAYTDWLRDVNAEVSMRDRYRVVQSFQPGPKGGLVSGPLSLVTESGIVQRVMLPLARGSVDEIVAAMPSAEPDDFRSAAVATLARMVEPVDGLDLNAAEKSRLAQAWSERFATATDPERAFLLATLPHGAQVTEMEAFDTAVERIVVGDSLEHARSNDTVLATLILTRVRSPDSPAFSLAADSVSEHVRLLGAALAQRLREGDRTYALAGPGAAGLAPPTDALRLEAGR